MKIFLNLCILIVCFSLNLNGQCNINGDRNLSGIACSGCEQVWIPAGNWSLSITYLSGNGWLSASPTSGSGSEFVTLTVTTNNSGSPRAANITYTCSAGTYVGTINQGVFQCSDYACNNCIGSNNDHLNGFGINIPLATNPTNTLNSMIGVNVGTEMDGYTDRSELSEVSSYLRVFHLMNHEFGDSGGSTGPCNFPANYTPIPCPFGTTNCWPVGDMAGFYHRYGGWQTNDGLNEVHSALAAYPNRQFPNKGWTAAEWGATLTDIQDNARLYAIAFAKTYAPTLTDCPSCTDARVEVLEVGNEWWGEPGIDEYHAIIRGMRDGLAEYYGSNNSADWRLGFVPGAFQAHDSDGVWFNPSINSTDYVVDMIPADIIPFLTAVNVHQYSFNIDDTGGEENFEYPESEKSSLHRIRSFIQWRDNNAAGLPIKLTEFGWDSKREGDPNSIGVGLKAQAIYLNRSLLMFSRWGIDKAVIYQAIDDFGISANDNYNSSGLLTNDKVKKPAFHAIKKLKSMIGDKVVLEIISEDDQGAFIYKIGDVGGVGTHLVAWRAVDINDVPDPENMTAGVILPANISLNSAGQAFLLDDEVLAGSYTTFPVSDIFDPLNNELKISPVPVVVPCGDDGPCCVTFDVEFDYCRPGPYTNTEMQIEYCENGSFTLLNIEDEVTIIKLYKQNAVGGGFTLFQTLCNDWSGNPMLCVSPLNIQVPFGTYFLEVQYISGASCIVRRIVLDRRLFINCLEEGGGRTKTSIREREITYNIFPNPASNIINVRFTDAEDVSSVVMTNLLGATVKQINKTEIESLTKINTTSLDPGCYLITVFRNDGRHESKKIIVQK